MRLSVIIPTCRRPADLIRCLQALRGQQRLPDEVFVALRADDSETLVALATWDPGVLPLRLVGVELAGASEARNRCIDLATGDVLVFIDDDTVPRRDFLALVRARFVAEPALGGLGGPDWIGGIELPEAERPEIIGRVRWWGRQVGNHHRGARQAQQVEWLKGANMSLRRAALGDRRFGQGLRGQTAQFGEDVALSLAVHRTGWILRYDPAVAVDHFPGQLPSAADHRRLLDDRSLSDAAFNETVLILAHLAWPGRLAFMAWHLLVGTRLLPGLLMAVYLRATGRSDGWHRGSTVRRARIAGWKAWRNSRTAAAVPSRVSPALVPREPVETGSP